LVRSAYLKDPAKIRERMIKTLAPFWSFLKIRRRQKRKERIKIDNKRKVGKLKE
jgi:hypothetical protein